MIKMKPDLKIQYDIAKILLILQIILLFLLFPDTNKFTISPNLLFVSLNRFCRNLI